MSTAYSSAKQQYIGNGVTTEWGFDFPIQKHSELKVYLKRSGSPQVLLEEGVDYSFVTDNTITFPIKTGESKLQAEDVLALQRESVFESEYNFSNQQRLEPEEVMHADDNLERQIQELKRDVTQAIRIQPTSNIDTDTFFEQVDRVYGSVDNIDTVANDKANVDKVAGSITNVNTVAGDIESVKTVANNIESVVVDATNISHIKTVSGSIANVNKTAGSIDNVNVVAPSISSVNTVSTNISDVNIAATNIAAIKDAPNQANAASQSATNAANSATASANSATASANSANNSHIWAEGTDAQVQALGGVHSSKVWAEQSTNANIALTNSPYTTNRILEIPQDIKLELNNGTLTLKAGSKVYVPNGFEADGTTPKFDVVVLSADKTGLQWVDTNIIDYMIFCAIGGGIDATRPERCTSGTSYPSSPANGDRCYRTDLNRLYVYRKNSSSWTEEESLPLGIVRSSGTAGKVESIEQVFNGFGYIGSTAFVLPSVKGQYANGRNVDGTCKSIVTTTTKVYTFTPTFGNVNDVGLWLRSGGTITATNQFYYDSDKNQIIYSQDNTAFTNICVAKFNFVDGKITSFEPHTVDSVLNSSLSNLSAAGQAKFDAKANINLSNLNNTGNVAASNLNSKGIRTVVDTYKNGDTWYRVWSDGQKEQGGSGSGALRITFPSPFSDTSYTILISRTNNSENVPYAVKTASTYFDVGWKIGMQNQNGSTTSFSWYACGY